MSAVLRGIARRALRNRAAISASADDAITFLIIVVKYRCELFLIAVVVFDFVPFSIIGRNFSAIERSIEILFDSGAYGVPICC